MIVECTCTCTVHRIGGTTVQYTGMCSVFTVYPMLFARIWIALKSYWYANIEADVETDHEVKTGMRWMVI